jgi:hypothetical protein
MKFEEFPQILTRNSLLSFQKFTVNRLFSAPLCEQVIRLCHYDLVLLLV